MPNYKNDRPYTGRRDFGLPLILMMANDNTL